MNTSEHRIVEPSRATRRSSGTHPVDAVGLRLRWLLPTLCCVLLTIDGCSSDDEPREPAASQPTAKSTPPTPVEPPEPEPDPLLPESKAWSREDALAKLADEAARLSAAVRLVHLSQVAPLCVPDPLPPKIARRLRVVALSGSLWAIGLAAPDESRLLAPVLIDAKGAVTLPLEGVEEEIALLYVAQDAEIFPHLLIVPERVLTVGDELLVALVAKSPEGLLFELRHENAYPHLALIWHGPFAMAGEESPAGTGEPVELARYNYDPYEFAFMGPLADKLPDPPGGLFELDLEQSQALIPVGGEIPEPPKFEPPRPAEGEPTPY